MAETSETELLNLTTEIVAAHVSKNAISVDQIPTLIREGPPDALGAYRA